MLPLNGNDKFDKLKDLYICAKCDGINDTAVVLPCSHEFHEKCVKIIQESGSQCPVCLSPFAAFNQALTTRAAVRVLLDQEDENSVAIRLHDATGLIFTCNLSADSKVARLFRAIEESGQSLNKAALTCQDCKMERYESLSEYLAKGQKELCVRLHAAGLDPELQNKSNDARALKNRPIYAVHLDKFIRDILMYGTKFDLCYKQVLNASLGTLIALTQKPDFHVKVQHNILGLTDLLGKPEFHYVYDNIYHDTTKPRKAATLFIIKGLIHSSEDVRKEAFKVFERLMQDYRLAGKDTLHKDAYGAAVFAICRAFFDSKSGKHEAAGILADLCRGNEEFLKSLTYKPYEIDAAVIQKAIHKGDPA